MQDVVSNEVFVPILGERLRDVGAVVGFGLDFLPGVVEVIRADLGAVVTDGEHAGFGTDRLDVGTGGLVGFCGQRGEVDVVGDARAFG